MISVYLYAALICRPNLTHWPPSAHHTATFTVLFEPTATVSLDSFASTRDYLILETLDTVKSRYAFWRYSGAAVADTGAYGAVSAMGPAGSRWEYCGAEAGEIPTLSAVRVCRLFPPML